MKYKEVINAINKGKNVFWSNDNYEIIKDELYNKVRYLIHSKSNNYYIGFNNDEYYLKKCYIK